jgi:hypothetical protein
LIRVYFVPVAVYCSVGWWSLICVYFVQDCRRLLFCRLVIVDACIFRSCRRLLFCRLVIVDMCIFRSCRRLLFQITITWLGNSKFFFSMFSVHLKIRNILLSGENHTN